VKQKIYLGTVLLDGLTQAPSASRFNAYGNSTAQSVFAVIPLSLIYVF